MQGRPLLKFDITYTLGLRMRVRWRKHHPLLKSRFNARIGRKYQWKPISHPAALHQSLDVDFCPTSTHTSCSIGGSLCCLGLSILFCHMSPQPSVKSGLLSRRSNLNAVPQRSARYEAKTFSACLYLGRTLCHFLIKLLDHHS